MNKSWSCLEELPTLSAAAAEWKQHTDDKVFNALCAGMYLQKGNRPAISVACVLKPGCAHRLVRRGESFVGKCKDEDGLGCDDIFLPADEAAVYELNLARLGRAVAVALKCNASDDVVGLERTRQIGFAAGEPTPVLLTIQGGEKDFCDVVTRLATRFSNGFVLVTPTLRFCGLALGIAGAVVFPIDPHLTLLADGKLGVSEGGRKLFARLVAKLNTPAATTQQWTTIDRLEYAPDFNTVNVDGKSYDLRGHEKARLCIKFLVDKKAFSRSSARLFLDEIIPYLRDEGNFPPPDKAEMKDFFKESSGELTKLRRLLVKSAGRNGKYFLSVHGN